MLPPDTIRLSALRLAAIVASALKIEQESTALHALSKRGVLSPTHIRNIRYDLDVAREAVIKALRAPARDHAPHEANWRSIGTIERYITACAANSTPAARAA